MSVDEGLSIGEIARLAGVTTRAIRHYHATGLVAEPARDSSGYRRYQAAELVGLVRVVRLRALGMPIPQIAARIGADGQLSHATELGSLVAELDAEIERLGALRDQLVQAIDSQALDEPSQALTRALREHGRLHDDADLSEPEAHAADLVDALHPHGVAGAIEDARTFLAQPAELHVLLQRYQALTNASSDAEIDALARDAAAVLPRPERTPTPVDIDVMDKLVGERLNSAQRRFMRQLRHALEHADD